jgi:hydrogenase maturation factor
MYVANEGTMVVAVTQGAGDKAVEVLKRADYGQAAVIGWIEPKKIVPVVVRGLLGRDRPLDEPLGAPLPRIC